MTELIAELATAHGGNVALAEDMIAAAADSGAHTVKFQHFTLSKLNPADPQREWLEQSHLDEKATERLMRACQREGVQFLSTPFDFEALKMLGRLGVTRCKMASSEAASPWWQGTGYTYVVSYPWRHVIPTGNANVEARLIAIPLYPTPLEANSARLGMRSVS